MPAYSIITDWSQTIAVAAGATLQNQGENAVYVCAVNPPSADDAIQLLPGEVLRIPVSTDISAATLGPRHGKLVIATGL